MPRDFSWMSPDEAVSRLREWAEAHADVADHEGQEQWLFGLSEPTSFQPKPIDQNSAFSSALDYVALQKAIAALEATTPRVSPGRSWEVNEQDDAHGW